LEEQRSHPARHNTHITN